MEFINLMIIAIFYMNKAALQMPLSGGKHKKMKFNRYKHIMLIY